MVLHTGQPSPSFTGTDEQGNRRSLVDYRGRWLLLYFYPKDDTSGCTAQACGFRDRSVELQGKVEILGVSADSVESHLTFKTKYSLPFPLLADTDRTIIQTYGATKEELGKRVSFLIDPEGVIRKIYTGIDCEKHAEQVVQDMKDFIGMT
ncbi:MAG: peroxiredoxin Q/BCP [Candidatus Peregrinibacteria bacterium Greene0416_19]|nr:MAG: peroxiredoxin Q/BCP [Candidatus Peregrinibacteria bacterium Greene0416_19]